MLNSFKANQTNKNNNNTNKNKNTNHNKFDLRKMHD